MGDTERRELARLAGDGDLTAAERLVILIRREQNVQNVPDLIWDDIKFDYGVLVRKAVVRACSMFGKNSATVTLCELAALDANEWICVKGCGSWTLGLIRDLLQQHGLAMPDEKCLLKPRAIHADHR